LVMTTNQEEKIKFGFY
jgi:hypothetical protein